MEEAKRTLLEECEEQLLRNQLPDGWTIGSRTVDDMTLLCVKEQTEEGFDRYVVLKAFKICIDGHWDVYALGQLITTESTPELEGMPAMISPENVMSAIHYLAELKICCGNGDAEFLQLRQARKDLFIDKHEEKSNFVDKRLCFQPTYPEKGTIRYVNCARLVMVGQDKQAPRCTQCTKYQGQLHVLKARASQNAIDGEYEHIHVQTC